MRARQLMPAALVLGSLVALGSCANGGGLRVEGAEAPTSTSTPSVSTNRGIVPESTPAPVALSLRQVRDTLLADKLLDAQSRKVLVKCSVIARCLTRGATVDVMHSGRPQLVVLIHTVESFVFGAFLMAVEPAGPRRVWSLTADQLKIIPSEQGDLVVESAIFTLDDRPCCPSGRRVEVYRWVGGQMVKTSSQDQKGD